MIHVLVVEDSPVQAELLCYILNADPGIEVVKVVGNGEEAVRAAARMMPHVITMDINMPGMNGYEATRMIMETSPRPIVIVTSSYSPEDVAAGFRAVEAGALAILEKPASPTHPEFSRAASDLVQTVKLMAEVRVVRRWPQKLDSGRFSRGEVRIQRKSKIGIVAIGASTGGPVVLQGILSKLPKDFPFPVLIVQHMAEGFTAGFVRWLSETTGFRVQVGMNDERVLPAHAYVAPEGMNMGLHNGGCIRLSRDVSTAGHRPSVSFMFRSVGDLYADRCVGILLTGMGSDGAEELKMLKEKGAITVVQNQESCVVYGMPGAAVSVNAATYVLPPGKIVTLLETLARDAMEEDLCP